MTDQELLQAVEAAEDSAKRLWQMSPPMITLKIYRRVTSERCKIAPGLYAQVVQWGNAQYPSIVRVLCSDVRKYLEGKK